MSRTTRFLTLAVTLLFGSLIATAATPDVGQKAPDFTLSTPDGHPMALADLTRQGTVVLVVLRGYPGYQCPFCVKQVHDFVEKADQFAASGTHVLLVYPGPPADLEQRAREALAKQNPLPANIHLVTDPDYQVTNQYGLRWDAPHETAYPSTFLIDHSDTIFFRKVSKGHGDRASANDILAQLNAKPAMKEMKRKSAMKGKRAIHDKPAMEDKSATADKPMTEDKPTPETPMEDKPMADKPMAEKPTA
jgi:peroxiredoxin